MEEGTMSYMDNNQVKIVVLVFLLSPLYLPYRYYIW